MLSVIVSTLIFKFILLQDKYEVLNGLILENLVDLIFQEFVIELECWM